MGVTRFARLDGNQIRLRHGAVRGLHGTRERAADALLLRAGFEVAGKRITTIEGLSADGNHPVQRAWVEEDVPQCGYCQSGQIMTAAALLSKTTHPTDADIDEAMRNNICRCGTYQSIRKAVHLAAQYQAGGKQ